tara:strand:- start:2017 stop:2697 length:681 start_codon:yes stop_codon:yes gene_type:complete
MKKNILIVDDEQDILDLLEYNLSKNNYNVITANNGSDALVKLNEKIDLIILDVMMPVLNGYAVCDTIKKNPVYKNVPILFLTAKNSPEDEYEGLVRGAIDYISKPISIKNLILRIKNILSNTISNREGIITFSDLSLDVDKMKVTISGKKIILTQKEYDILLLLVKSPGKVFTRDELLNSIWGHDMIVTDRTIDVHITKLRKKITLNTKSYIHTSHGRGYYFEDAV